MRSKQNRRKRYWCWTGLAVLLVWFNVRQAGAQCNPIPPGLSGSAYQNAVNAKFCGTDTSSPQIAHVLAANLPASVTNGLLYYVDDGLPGSVPCQGGGSGAIAQGINGVWTCGAPGGGGTPTTACGQSAIVLSSGGTATYSDACVTTTSYCSCRDQTDPSQACYADNATAGSVVLYGNASDQVQALCAIKSPVYPAVSSCVGTLNLSSGSGTFSNSCIVAQSYCSCRDQTVTSNSCYADNPTAGSVLLHGNANDAIQAICSPIAPVSNTPIQACTAAVLLASGTASFVNSCVTAQSYCACRDVTTPGTACYTDNPAANSVVLHGSGSDVVQAQCSSQGPVSAPSVANYTGPINMTGVSTNGSDAITSANINGTVYAPTYGVKCDNLNDQTANLQAAISGTQTFSGTTLGTVYLPASCNAATGHQLKLNSTVTLPSHTKLIGLGGECHEGDNNCVTINCAGASGTCMSSTNTSGAGLENIRLVNTGSETTGLDLAGVFSFSMKGAGAENFGNYGILLEDSSSASTIYNNFQDCYGYRSGIGLYLWQHNATKSVNGNQFTNCRFLQSTGTANVRITGIANENVFSVLDISHGPLAIVPPTVSGMLIDNYSGRDTVLSGVTAEGLGTIFNFGAGVAGFVATGVDGGFFSGVAGTPIVADPTALYDISWGAFGNTAVERDQAPSNVNRLGFGQINGYQDPTGQLGGGYLQNLVTNSEALTNAAWVKVNAGAQSITDNVADAACAPQCGSIAGGSPTASRVALTGTLASCSGPTCTSSNAWVRQSYANGGEIQNTCFTLKEWFKLDPISTGTPPAYIGIALQDNAAGNQISSNYSLTSTPTWAVVKNCYTNIGTGHTSVLAYAVKVDGANNLTAQNGIVIDVWGIQLQKSGGYGPYLKTTSSAITGTVSGLAAPVTYNTGFGFSQLASYLTADGMTGYCKDCANGGTEGGSCVGSGSGQFVLRANGFYKCF